MAFIPVPNTLMVEIVYEQDGQVMENTLYYEKPGGGVILSDIEELLEEINLIVRVQLLPLLSNTLQVLRIVGTMIDVVGGLTAISTTSLPAPGESTSPPLPNSVSVVMSLRTGLAGRSFRGRNYVPGLAEDAIAGNTVNSTMIAALIEVWNALRLASGDPGWQNVVVSRFSNNAPRVTGVTTPITSVVVFDDQVDNQRRRLPGRGR